MIESIFELIKCTRGTNAKKQILLENQNNKMMIKGLKYALDPFMAFNIVKVRKTTERNISDNAWELFFDAADKCASRSVTGGAAIDLLSSVFSKSTPTQEVWMRKILKKHLAIGVSEKSVNSVITDLIPTFNVSLAKKFDFKRIKSDTVAIEPKLDGIRCFAIVENNTCVLYARSGKQITNFDDTIGKELLSLGEGCYDGEIMGEDFIALMRQAYRKEDIDTSDTYFALFDYLSLTEWKNKKSITPTCQRYDELLARVSNKVIDSVGMGVKNNKQFLKPVKRKYISTDMPLIKAIHDDYVHQGYEGAMIKDIHAPYKFGRGWEVMKYKDFHDVDLPIDRLLEGTGKHSDKLGSVVVCFNGVNVQVGSGFSDELREKIWKNKELFIGSIIEVRYQEVTPDGSLRFPTFVCFRNDR